MYKISWSTGFSAPPDSLSTLCCSAVRTNLTDLRQLPHDKILLSGSLAVVNSSREISSSLSLTSSIPVTVFVDDGCTGFALLDIDFARQNKISLLPIVSPISVVLADKSSSSAGPIIFSTPPLQLSLGGHIETITFLVTSGLPSPPQSSLDETS